MSKAETQTDLDQILTDNRNNMENLNEVQLEIKESLEQKMLHAFAEGDDHFDAFVSSLSEEQKELIPNLSRLFEAGGVNPRPSAPSIAATPASKPSAGGLFGMGGFPKTTPPGGGMAGNGGFPDTSKTPIIPQKAAPSPSMLPRGNPVMNSYNNVPGNVGSGGGSGSYRNSSTGANYEAPYGSSPGVQSGPAPVRPAPVAQETKPPMKLGGPVNKVVPPKPAVQPQKSVAPKPVSKPATIRPATPVRPNKPITAKPVRPVSKAKPTFRATGASDIGSHMSRSLGGLNEEKQVKESFESFLRNKFLKG